MAKQFLPFEKPTEGTEGIVTPALGGVPPDSELIEDFKKKRKESFDDRWLWEREWQQKINYVNHRHWVEYVRRTNEWRDVRLAKWFPKPVTPMVRIGLQTLRAMFAAVDIGVNVRPNGADPKNVVVASIADDYAPVLHEEHDMSAVLDEGDFWFIVTGNVFYHTFFERDAKYGYDELTFEMCLGCQMISDSAAIAEAGQMCPECGANQFVESNDPETGEPIKKVSKGKGKTVALSPFEVAFPSGYPRFADVPYLIRPRWRSKEYYESHPTLKNQVVSFNWQKAPAEQSLQLFRSLPFQSSIGLAPVFGSGEVGSQQELGAVEYEVWIRPCDKYPDGLVYRVLGDANPIVLHLEEDEALPGPIPYKDAEGKPLFTFTHAGFEHKGGCVWAMSPFDGAIQKVNQLNQLDAFGLMIVNRMGNPLWLVPKGAEIEKFTGEPGLVVKWNPLTVGGNAKPERVDGMELGSGFFKLREQYVHEIEEALGTYDVLKGSKPSGVEAFAALDLLVQQGQSRHTSAFKSRGRAYADWFKFALEIEREFGPDERTQWVMSPARGWALEVFKKANLQGSFSVLVEEGSQKPKTALGIRAAIQHLASLQVIDVTDPDQRYAILQAFGQPKLNPSLDIHKQAALRKQEEFEKWAADPMAQQQSMMQASQAVMEYQQQLATIAPPPEAASQMDPATGAELPPDPAIEQQQMQQQIPPPPSPTAFTPLEWLDWYKASVHEQEFLKWANSDRMVVLMKQNPALKPLLKAHLAEIRVALSTELMMQMGGGSVPPQGAGMAMANSNQEAGGLDVMPGSRGAARQGQA